MRRVLVVFSFLLVFFLLFGYFYLLIESMSTSNNKFQSNRAESTDSSLQYILHCFIPINMFGV